MGEEPERLRARAEVLREIAESIVDIRTQEGRQLLKAAETIESLLAEVERLARERDGAQLALESNAPLILDLTAEVERLAGERDEWKQAAGAEAQLFDESRRFNESIKAECERLAGRVAALTEALNDLDRWADGAEYGWYVKGVTQAALADVGG